MCRAAAMYSTCGESDSVSRVTRWISDCCSLDKQRTPSPCTTRDTLRSTSHYYSLFLTSIYFSLLPTTPHYSSLLLTTTHYYSLITTSHYYSQLCTTTHCYFYFFSYTYTPIARYVLLNTHYSLLIVHCSLFTIHYALITTYSSLLTTHY